MPEMNGRELAIILRRRFPNLPIVLLTGDTEVGEPDDAIDVILSKPFQIEVVEATIQRLI
jgi:CheY-like chemotaxis protein